MSELLKIENLSISFETKKGLVNVVNNISFDVQSNEIVALVGESASGKSVTSLAIMGLLAKNGRVTSGTINYKNNIINKLRDKEMYKLRGKEIAMIFQEPMTSLDPLYSVGYQIAEVLMLEEGMTKTAAKQRSIELLKQVGITDPERRYDSYPHELSGGMRQRVVIAIALARNPKLIIADEPTTALDVTIQKQILQLLKKLCEENGISILLITHDLAIVKEYANRIIVMYAGNLMEQSDTKQLFANPYHPYTQGLLNSVPSYTANKSTPLYVIPGSIPMPSAKIKNYCVFAARCAKKTSRCEKEKPEFKTVDDNRKTACFLDISNAGG